MYLSETTLAITFFPTAPLMPYLQIRLELNKGIIGRKMIIFLMQQGKHHIPCQKIIPNVCHLLRYVSLDKSLNFSFSFLGF